MTECEVLGRARQNFEARNRRGDRTWSPDAEQGRYRLVLSDTERAEFIDYARYELELGQRGIIGVWSVARASDATWVNR
jgi:hypothetical protein